MIAAIPVRHNLRGCTLALSDFKTLRSKPASNWLEQ